MVPGAGGRALRASGPLNFLRLREQRPSFVFRNKAHEHRTPCEGQGPGLAGAVLDDEVVPVPLEHVDLHRSVCGLELVDASGNWDSPIRAPLEICYLVPVVMNCVLARDQRPAARVERVEFRLSLRDFVVWPIRREIVLSRSQRRAGSEARRTTYPRQRVSRSHAHTPRRRDTASRAHRRVRSPIRSKRATLREEPAGSRVDSKERMLAPGTRHACQAPHTAPGREFLGGGQGATTGLDLVDSSGAFRPASQVRRVVTWAATTPASGRPRRSRSCGRDRTL